MFKGILHHQYLRLENFFSKGYGVSIFDFVVYMVSDKSMSAIVAGNWPQIMHKMNGSSYVTIKLYLQDMKVD